MEAFGFKVSSLFGCRQRRKRARGLTDKNLNSGLRFKCGEEKLRLEVSFPPRFSIASDEQPVHATELKSSSKNPQTHPGGIYGMESDGWTKLARWVLRDWEVGNMISSHNR